MLAKVISGGQTGVDIAGLRAAQRHGIATGGWMPKGCITTEGPHFDYLGEFGMKEHPHGYKERTWQNVFDADATIRIAKNFDSPGEICTLNAIQEYGKRYIDVDAKLVACSDQDWIGSVATWISTRQIKILNVAGNSELTSPNIYNYAYEFLRRVFFELDSTYGWSG